MKNPKTSVGEFLLPYLDTSPLRRCIISLLASVQEGQGVDQLTGLLSTLKKDATVTSAVIGALRNHGDVGKRALTLFQQEVQSQHHRIGDILKKHRERQERKEPGARRTEPTRHVSRYAYLSRILGAVSDALAAPFEGQQRPRLEDFETLAFRLMALINGQPRGRGRSNCKVRTRLRTILRSVFDRLRDDGATESLKRLARDPNFGFDALLRLDPRTDQKGYAKIARLHVGTSVTRSQYHQLVRALERCGCWGQAVLRNAYRSKQATVRAKTILMQSAPVSNDEVVSLLSDSQAAPALRLQAAQQVALDPQSVKLLLSIIADPRTPRRLADSASRRLSTLGSSLLLQIIQKVGSVQSRKALHRLDHLRRRVTGEVCRETLEDTFATIIPAKAVKKVVEPASSVFLTNVTALRSEATQIPVAKKASLAAAVSPQRLQVQSFRRNRLRAECRTIVARGLRQGAAHAARFVQTEARSLSTTFKAGLDRLLERIRSQKEAIQFALATVAAIWDSREICEH